MVSAVETTGALRLTHERREVALEDLLGQGSRDHDARAGAGRDQPHDQRSDAVLRLDGTLTVTRLPLHHLAAHPCVAIGLRVQRSAAATWGALLRSLDKVTEGAAP